MRNNGVVPANYLLDGLKEMAFILGSWTRTRDVFQKHQVQIPLNINHGQLIEQLSRTVSKLEVLAQQETDRSKERPAVFGSPLKSPRKSPSSSSSAQRKEKALTLRLATTTSHVLTTKEDDQKISMKLSVPQTKIVSSSANQHPYPGSLGSTTGAGGRREERGGGEEVVIASGQRRGSGGRRGGRESWEMEEEGEEEEYNEGDLVCASLDESESETAGGEGSTKGQSNKDDDLWRPEGPVRLVKGSVASTSRKKRNIRRHSFDTSLSLTSAKMARLDGDKKSAPTPPYSVARPGLVGEAKATDPVLGGGSLRSETSASAPASASSSSSSTTSSTSTSSSDSSQSSLSLNPQRARAAAAASAVNAALAASKPKAKPLTVKQRLGKIMGLGKSGRWK